MSIKLVDVFIGNRKVGRLAQTNNGICAFEYFSTMSNPYTQCARAVEAISINGVQLFDWQQG